MQEDIREIFKKPTMCVSVIPIHVQESSAFQAFCMCLFTIAVIVENSGGILELFFYSVHYYVAEEDSDSGWTQTQLAFDEM